MTYLFAYIGAIGVYLAVFAYGLQLSTKTPMRFNKKTFFGLKNLARLLVTGLTVFLGIYFYSDIVEPIMGQKISEFNALKVGACNHLLLEGIILGLQKVSTKK